jgi:A/G-specific adenine glycosylase
MEKMLRGSSLGRFQKSLLGWFRRHRRDLPWRASRDPYRIWVAEIMLQQTRIAAVIPYYERFLSRFPTVEALADAPSSEVLRYWAGLGYYSRARNLQAAAKKIVGDHAGKFPRTHEEALALPGIGTYTAAAVLSIAYDVPLAVLDGNVARVLARIGGVRGDLREPVRWKKLKATADALLARKSASDWNQALMELGEVVCTPQAPKCGECPVGKSCVAYEKGLVNVIPAPRKKRAPVRVQIAAAILRDPAGRTILVKDPGAHDDVLFSRMWQFPAVEVSQDAQAELIQHVREILGVQLPRLQPLPAAKHGVTFRSITLLPFLAEVAVLPKLARTRIVTLGRVGDMPVSSATKKIARAANQPMFPELTAAAAGAG